MSGSNPERHANCPDPLDVENHVIFHYYTLVMDALIIAAFKRCQVKSNKLINFEPPTGWGKEGECHSCLSSKLESPALHTQLHFKCRLMVGVWNMNFRKESKVFWCIVVRQCHTVFWQNLSCWLFNIFSFWAY